MEMLAVPASPTPFMARVADGREVPVYLRGDEYFHWYEDAGGNYLTPKGDFFSFADEREQAWTVAAQKQARRVYAAPQIESSFPRSGTVRVVVLLVEYADKSFVVDEPIAHFTRLFNESHYADNGSTGSVRDYYLASSGNQLDLQFDVYGPFTLSREEAYYGGNTSTSSTKNAQALVKEAVLLADASGVDFTLYDNTGAGKVDNVSIITAGHNEAEGGSANSIWPHQSHVWNTTYVDGELLTSYLMTSELRGRTGSSMAHIGTFCHEFGHVLGLPDLYHTENGKVYTVGSWDIMCQGSYNNSSRTPPLYSSFEQFIMGWLVPEQLSSGQRVTIGSLQSSGKAYLVAASAHNMKAEQPSPSEYFLIENRQRQGWDSIEGCLPGTGLLISHITFNQYRWSNNSFNNFNPLGYAIEAAYPMTHTQSVGSDTYPGTMCVSSFVPTLNYGRKLSQYTLSNIFQRNNGDISFVFGTDSEQALRIEPSELDTFITTYSTKVEDYETQVVHITGKELSTPTVRIIPTGRFQLSTDGTNWGANGKWIEDSVGTDGSYEKDIHVRYHPGRQSCSLSAGLLTVLTTDSSAYATISLKGIAPRPMYVYAPDSLYVDLRETTSIRVGWREVEDAESYYVRLLQTDITGRDTVYQEVERREVLAPNTQALFSGLISGWRYTAVVCSAEKKSCFEHVSAPSSILTSTIVEKKNNRVLPVLSADGRYVLWIGEPLEEENTIAVYKEDGKFLFSQTVPAGTFNPTIPVEKMKHGELYFIKLYSSSMKRNSLWAKFIYY